jgi:hypothetical protein
MIRLRSSRTLRVLLLAIGCLGWFGCSQGRAQVEQSAVGGDELMSVGGVGSLFHNNYGQRTLGGAGVFVDLDWNRHYGLEGEANWSFLHQRDEVHDTTYLIGPRYSFNGYRRFRPYVKGLVGDGEFNFPYNYGHGSYLVVAPGGGVDFRVNRRLRLRLADFEYQYWPNFSFGALTNYGVSAGLKIRIF